jgi:lysophospholipid acyltransferase (LPLAT)-like uncharacterized protein
MFKKLLRARPVLRGAGRAMAAYLKLVRRTNRFVIEPGDAATSVYGHSPVIIAMWHGQHFMIPYIKRPEDKAAVIISRHGDGEINAAAVEAFGFITVRGSGAQRKDQIRKRGGVEALRAGLSVLRSGASLGLTADVPKVSRVAGKGIITLAQISGPPDGFRQLGQDQHRPAVRAGVHCLRQAVPRGAGRHARSPGNGTPRRAGQP